MVWLIYPSVPSVLLVQACGTVPSGTVRILTVDLEFSVLSLHECTCEHIALRKSGFGQL